MNDFITVIEELIQLFQDLIQIEQAKLEAAEKNRITHVENCMKKEQAILMKLRSLDKKRETCQVKLGYKGYTFQQILSETPQPEQLMLKELFNTLSFLVRQFHDVNESVRSMIEVNLHMINKAINKSPNGMVSDKVQWEELV